MNNFSFSGEDVFLQGDKSYFVIDSLFLNDIKSKIPILTGLNLESDIREKVFAFPRTDTPFTILTTRSKNETVKFSVASIVRAVESDDKLKCFDCDSGLLMLIERSIMLDVLQYFDYGDLVDSITEPVNTSYWSMLYTKYKEFQLALILAPGVDTGYQFEGSGHYKIEENHIDQPRRNVLLPGLRV